MTVVNTNPEGRKILLLCYIPAMAFCIASATEARWHLPAVGMVPLHFSVIMAVIVLAVERKKTNCTNSDEHSDEEENSRLLGSTVARMKRQSSVSPVFLFVMDFLTAGGHLAVLIVTYMTLNHRQGRRYMSGSNPVATMLQTYATVPLWVCFFVHAYSVLVTLPTAWRSLQSRKSGPKYTCPNCHTPAVRAPQGYTLAPQNDEPEVAQAPFRDASFDGDAVIRPDAAETGSNNSRDSKES